MRYRSSFDLTKFLRSEATTYETFVYALVTTWMEGCCYYCYCYYCYICICCC